MLSKANMALLLLLLQNCSQMVMMRVTLVESSYSSGVAVMTQEALKFCFSFFLLMYLDNVPPSQVITVVLEEITEKPSRSVALLFPGVLYAIQNNLLYFAMANLSGPTCAALYQLKLLTTAFFTVTFLKRQLSATKWMWLFVLFCGAACVQVSTSDGSAEPDTTPMNPVLGVLAVLAACASSGIAGTFLELKLKDQTWSLWTKNILLSACGAVVSGAGVVMTDWARVSTQGLYSGFTPAVWFVVLDISCGGLLVAVVVKYADTIRKGFATTLSLVLSTVVAFTFYNFSPSPLFFVGLVCVVSSSMGYAKAHADEQVRQRAKAAAAQFSATRLPTV